MLDVLCMKRCVIWILIRRISNEKTPGVRRWIPGS
jgi:hypothetical protein